MPKEVTVLGLEGPLLRGVRFVASGKGYQLSASQTWDLTPRADDAAAPSDPADDAAEEKVSAEEAAFQELTAALADAVKTFGTHEFVLAMPLAKVLVESVRVSAEKIDALEEEARTAIEAISPFPDETYRVGAEVQVEGAHESVATVAALPDAVSLDLGEALEAAKARIVRTDLTALGRLRTLWPQVVATGNMPRRLVIMNAGDGWDFIVVDDEAPVALRGMGQVTSVAEIAREVMLGIIRAENVTAGREVGEIVVFSAEPADPALVERLSAFGPVRQVALTDDAAYAGVEGVADRTVEGASLDVTPEAWRTALAEARFKKALFRGLSAAAALWLLAMGGLFGVPLGFNFLTDRDKAASKQHASAYKAVKDMKDRVKLVQRYSDHARGALETLKAFSDRAPTGVTLSQFTYRRGESVRISAEAEQPTEAYAFKNALAKAENETGGKLYAEVTLSEVKQSRGGMNRFDIEAKFDPEEEAPAAAAKGRGKGGR